MPSSASPAGPDATVIAPDGITIHTFATPPGAFVGVAEGRIPPGRYGIHRHLSLEQYTYVVAGSLSAITGPDATRTPLHTGDLLLTLPGESLQFLNEGAEEARVLFICAPPYPQDDADTESLTAHGPLDAAARQRAIDRLETIRAAFNATVDARIAALRD